MKTEIFISISKIHILRNLECMKRPDTEFFQLIAEKMAGERESLAVG